MRSAQNAETELSKKLGELGMNPEHLAPMATVIGIEPAELSVLEDCDVSLDAMNFLGKRLDDMSKSERNQFLAVLSQKEICEGWGLKNIINLTYNLSRFTLIGDTNNLEQIGRTHMLNIRGALSESEYKNCEWLAEEGRKLLDSGKGIDTEYGKLYINDDVPFDEIFYGRTFPVYYCSSNAVAAVEIGYDGYKESVELPCEEIAIKKAISRLGADNISDCQIEIDPYDLDGEWLKNARYAEKTKDIFGLNNLLKSEDVHLKQEQPMNIFQKEIARRLSEDGYDFTFENGEFAVTLNDGDVIKIRKDDVLYSNGEFSENGREAFYALYHLNRSVLDYCTAYEKAPLLKAENLSGNYCCLAEFNGTVLAAKYNDEFGFEFVTWDRTYDGKAVCQGKYFEDYAAAKENFAIRSGLIDGDKYFENSELERLRNCVKFAMENDGNLHFDEYDALKKLDKKISESVPEYRQDSSPKLSM